MRYEPRQEHGRGIHDLESSGQISHRLSPLDVELSPAAKTTVGMAAQEIALQLEMPLDLIKARTMGKMYWLEPSDELMIVISMPEIEADMFVNIPAGHWRLRQRPIRAH